MSKIYINIPFSLPLSNEKNWQDTSGKKRNFFIARCHFMIKERQAENKTSTGEIISALQATKGATVGKVKSIEVEQERIDFVESLEKSLISNEMVFELVQNISSELGNENIGKFKNDFKTSWSNKLKTEFSSSLKYSTSVRERTTEKYELSYNVNTELDDRLVVASVYKKIAWDVYLTYVDFLFVDYETKMFGLRKKRRHKPHYANGKPQNILKFNTPICCLKFWKPLENSGLLLREDEYNQEVKEPNEIEIAPAENLHRYHVELQKDQPTLYQLAVAAFPLKWIQRKGNWTMDELINIEFEEAKHSAWWYTHGPGKGTW